MQNKNTIRITNHSDKKKLAGLLLSLTKRTTENFNYFGIISKKTIDSIVNKELKRRDKIKFFSYLGDDLIAYSFLTKFEKKTKRHNCTLGIVIGDEWQKKGFGQQICKNMIETAWKKGYEKIWLTVFSDNVYAIALYRTLGFEVEGIFIADEISKNRDRDVVSMAIFKTVNDTVKKRFRMLKNMSEL
jgi:RimJ/RimL family protein N-acetyltransferase